MKILICSDGSSQAENAIRFGGLIAEACRAEATIFGITEKAEDEDRVFESLRRGQQLLKERGVRAELITKAGDPIEEIVKRTEETAYDLVVIGASRKGTRGPFLMSAKAYKIIKAASPPVLVVIGNKSSLKRRADLQRRRKVHRQGRRVFRRDSPRHRTPPSRCFTS